MIIIKKEIIKTEMKVMDNLVGVMRVGDIDYISLTDLAKYKNDKNPANVIIHWLSNKDTALYVGLWEELNNENFNFTEYREIKINEIGTSSYTMSPKQYVALFGMTAKEWKQNNPELIGNIRDYANILQLVILSNLKNLNSEMIEQGIQQSKRIERLNAIAKKQYDILQDNKGIKKIEKLI